MNSDQYASYEHGPSSRKTTSIPTQQRNGKRPVVSIYCVVFTILFFLLSNNQRHMAELGISHAGIFPL